MSNIIPIRPKEYGYCSECSEQSFFLILDDEGNLTESECTTCGNQAEFELNFFDVECEFED